MQLAMQPTVTLQIVCDSWWLLVDMNLTGIVEHHSYSIAYCNSLQVLYVPITSKYLAFTSSQSCAKIELSYFFSFLSYIFCHNQINGAISRMNIMKSDKCINKSFCIWSIKKLFYIYLNVYM